MNGTCYVSTLAFKDDVGRRQTDGPNHVVEGCFLFQLYKGNVVAIRLAVVGFVHVNRLGGKVPSTVTHLAEVVFSQSYSYFVRLEAGKEK